MKKMTMVWLLALALLAGHAVAFAEGVQEEDQHYRDTRKLLETTGAMEMGSQFGTMWVNHMVQVLRSVREDIPPEVTTILQEEIIDTIEQEMTRPDGLQDQLIMIYNKYYSHGEILELLAFYETDLGKKLIATMPQISQESMNAGQLWAQKIGPEIDSRLRARFKEEGFDYPYE